MAGFGLVIPFTALIKTSDIKKIAIKQLFVLTGIQVIRIAGIGYFILWVAENIIAYSAPINGAVPVQVKLFGPYWVLAWFAPLMYLLLTQAFWFKKLYMNRPALIVLAILLLVLPSQRFIAYLTSLYNDYLPSSFIMYQGSIILELFLNCVVFTFIVFAILLGTGKLKQLQNP